MGMTTEEMQKQVKLHYTEPEYSINVAKVLTYGFDTCAVSPDKNINKKIHDAMLSRDDDFFEMGSPVGYIINNTGSKPMTIKVPKYTLNGARYEGVVEDYELLPKQFVYLPTKFIILLLMMMGRGLKVGNGEFVKLDPKLKTDDIDIAMSNFYFRYADSSVFFEYFRSLESIAPIGYETVRSGKYDGLHILEDFYLERFGNIENWYNDGFNNTVSEEDNRNTDGARFIGALLNG